MCQVGHALAEIEIEDGSAAAETPVTSSQKAQAPVQQAQKQEAIAHKEEHRASPGKNKALATPAVRHIARTKGVDIN